MTHDFKVISSYQSLESAKVKYILAANYLIKEICF